MIEDSVISLLTKLSAITEERGSSEAEVLFAAEKISQLKKKYNIDLKDLLEDEYEATGTTIETGYKKVPRYLSILLAELADVFDCKVVRMSEKSANGTVKYILVGLPHDVTMCEHFYIYLSRIIKSEARGRKNKNDYCFGMILAIIEKLSPTKEKESPESKNERGIVIHKNTAVNKYIADKIGKIRKRTTSFRRDEDSHKAGMKKGSSIPLGKPVNNVGQVKLGM